MTAWERVCMCVCLQIARLDSTKESSSFSKNCPGVTDRFGSRTDWTDRGFARHLCYGRDLKKVSRTTNGAKRRKRRTTASGIKPELKFLFGPSTDGRTRQSNSPRGPTRPRRARSSTTSLGKLLQLITAAPPFVRSSVGWLVGSRDGKTTN